MGLHQYCEGYKSYFPDSNIFKSMRVGLELFILWNGAGIKKITVG